MEHNVPSGNCPSCEFLVDDARLCVYSFNPFKHLQSGMVEGGEGEREGGAAVNRYCCGIVGNLLVGRQDLAADLQFCPSAGRPYLRNEGG